MIRVQSEDFDLAAEVAAMSGGNLAIGGVCAFVGLVRDFADDDSRIKAMTLEHYPGMTEKALAGIEKEANQRWPLEASLIIHRYGRLEAGDRIVLVAAASAHRSAAFDACRFLIDWLKTEAPFWKLEEAASGTRWVEAKGSDGEVAGRWSRKE
ncbi:MAG: molybdenum cofactor biosynthesis protein MoaE [Rhodospirillales bacterium]